MVQQCTIQHIRNYAKTKKLPTLLCIHNFFLFFEILPLFDSESSGWQVSSPNQINSIEDVTVGQVTATAVNFQKTL